METPPAGDRHWLGTRIATPTVFGLFAGAGALVAWAGFRALSAMSAVLVVLVAAVLLAVGLQRAVTVLRRHRVPPRAALLIVVGGLLAVAIGAVALFLPFLIDQAQALGRELGATLDRLQASSTGRRFDDSYDLSARLRELFTPERVRALASGVLGGVGAVVGITIGVLTTGVLTLYLLASFDRVTAAVYRAMPASKRENAARIGADIITKIGSYLVGVALVAVCAGSTALVFMLVTGIPYAMVLALVVAAFDTIPQVGATIGASLVVLIGWGESFGVALAATVFFIVYQQIENWLIYPRVMRYAVRVSGLAALLSVLAGTAIAGVFGALVAVPTYAAVSIVAREVLLPRQDAR